MTNRLAQYEGNFIKAEDLPIGKAFNFVVARVAEPMTVDGGDKRKVDKAVLFFDGKDKSLIMNKTHYAVMKTQFGADFSQWVGKTVILQRRHLLRSMGEWNVACVRIIPPNGTAIRKGLIDRLGASEPYTEAEIEKAKTKGKRGDDE